MAVRIDDRRRTVAVGLVRRWAVAAGAGGDGALVDLVDVGHGEVQRGGGATERGRADRIEVGILVGQVHAGAADAQLGVPHPAVVADIALDLGSAEGGDVPLDRLAGGRGADVRDDRGGDRGVGLAGRG